MIRSSHTNMKGVTVRVFLTPDEEKRLSQLVQYHNAHSATRFNASNMLFEILDRLPEETLSRLMNEAEQFERSLYADDNETEAES